MSTFFTPHFSLEELEASRTADRLGIDNRIPDELLPKALALCKALEQVRELLGVPMNLTSGYRCPRLNRAVGGQRTSQHMAMEAADFIPKGKSPLEAWGAIKVSKIPYDQLILEHDSAGNTWVHFSVARDGQKARRMAFQLEK